MSDENEPLEPLQEIEVAPGFKIKHTSRTTEAAKETAAMFERIGRVIATSDEYHDVTDPAVRDKLVRRGED
jgi:hypothetical protein